MPILGIILTTNQIHCVRENLRALAGVRENSRDSKIPINIDLSGDAPRGIWVLQSSFVPICKTYIVEPKNRNTHRIGAILDGGVNVLNDDERNVERLVYFSIEHDGMKVLKITNSFMTEDGIQKEIVEMVKLPGELLYEELVRIPVDVELMERNGSGETEVTVISPTRRQYKLKDSLINRAYIATVRYAGCLVPLLHNHDIITREVVLYTRRNIPRIIITTHTKDGNNTRVIYRFVDDENGKRIVRE